MNLFVIIGVRKSKGVKMKNTYTKATKENLEKLIAKGCAFGIDTKEGLLMGECIAINEFNNMYSFSKSKCIKMNLQNIEL